MGVEDRLRLYVEAIRAEACDAAAGGVSDRVMEGFARVPRHRFVERFFIWPADGASSGGALTRLEVDQASPDAGVLDMVYSDRALVTRLDDWGRPSSSTSQPSLMAAMLELLDVSPGMRVLEIGTGTGYNAALLAELVGDVALVTTVDVQADVVEQARRLLHDAGYGGVHVLCRDGMEGVSEHAPFDRIMATVGCPDVSWTWVNQLTQGSVMLVPLQHGGPNVAPLVRLHVNPSGDLEGMVVAWSGFMPMQGNQSSGIWPSSVADVSVVPDQTFDLPTALTESPRTWESYRNGQQAWWDFAYFLALDDPRTHFGDTLALVDPNGGRLVLTNDNIALYGSKELHRDLLASYQRWENLGRPVVTDWHTTLVPRHRPRPTSGPHRKTWLLARPTSWQLVYLT